MRRAGPARSSAPTPTPGRAAPKSWMVARGYRLDEQRTRPATAANRRLIDYALFIALFAHLIAGPIQRHGVHMNERGVSRYTRVLSAALSHALQGGGNTCADAIRGSSVDWLPWEWGDRSPFPGQLLPQGGSSTRRCTLVRAGPHAFERTDIPGRRRNVLIRASRRSFCRARSRHGAC